MSTTVTTAANTINSNGGRKMVRLSNNWIVLAVCNPDPVPVDLIYFHVSKDDGASFTQLCTTSGSNKITDFAIANVGTTIHCIFTNGVPTVTDVQYCSFDASTVTNTTISATIIHSTGASVGYCSLVADGTGALHASYSYGSPSLIAYKSKPNGGAWSATTTISAGGTDPYNHPSIVVDNNNLPGIAYDVAVSSSGTKKILFSRYGGSTWTTTTIHSDATYEQSYPCAYTNASGSYIFVVWQGKDATDSAVFNIRYASSAPSGNSFTIPSKRTSGNTYDQKMPTATINPSNNDEYLFFQGRSSGSYDQIRYMKTTSGTWSGITNMTSNTTNHAQTPSSLFSTSDAIRFMYQDLQSYKIMYNSIVFNSAPNAPTHKNISSSGYTLNTRPKLFATVSDPDSGNTITDVQFQISNASSFATLKLDVSYASYPEEFDGMPTTTNTASVVTMWYSHPNWSALTAGTWYLRVRAKDNNGAWSAWSATQSFVVASAPWTDTIPDDAKGFKAQWLNDIATVTKNAVLFRGMGDITNLYEGGTLSASSNIKAFHIIERREFLQPIFGIVGVTPTWASTSLTSLMNHNQTTGGSWNGNTSGFALSSGTGVTFAYDSTVGYKPSSGSIKMTNGGTATQLCSISTFGALSPITAGQSYSAGAMVKVTAGIQPYLAIRFYDASGTYISGVGGYAINGTGGWDFIKVLNKVAPANATQASVAFYVQNMPVGDVAWWDSAWLVQGNPYEQDRTGQHIIDLRNYCSQT